MKKALLFTLLFFQASFLSSGQDITLSKVEPPFWWIGFKNPELQLLVYGKDIGKTDPSIFYPGVDIMCAHVMNNPDYYFLDILISKNAEPGFLPISFYLDGKLVAEYLYELKARDTGSSSRNGFNSSDVIYLLMPDRFANGDTSNDNGNEMLESAGRNNPDGRHGGDIQGIVNHLDYIKELGATTLWITPLLENNVAKYSYHGYSITDHYRIDPRFGSDEDYRALTGEIHRRGMKVIMDMVFNHCGSTHWWMTDPPAKDWFNNWPEFTRTSYRIATLTDPYISAADRDQFDKGWFDTSMPDLNQHNPFLATYLIQNSIWWIEYAGIDGIRLDTYPYSFKDFMVQWDQEVLDEYPGLNIVGECWLSNPAGIAYWQKDAMNRDGYNSYLPGVFDFSLYDALRVTFMEKEGWGSGILRLYDVLAQDFLYPDPSHLVTFADNHDVKRYLESQGDDARRLKMAMAFILTTRGIPEIYYGTEILMTTGTKTGDGGKRVDFPGGWPGDTTNAFTDAGRTLPQNDMYNYLHTLLNWRRNKEVIHSGKLTHFVPRDGVYVYFRHNEKETVMVALNNNPDDAKTIDAKRYNEFLGKFSSGTEIITGTTISDLSNITIQPKSAVIIELKSKE